MLRACLAAVCVTALLAAPADAGKPRKSRERSYVQYLKVTDTGPTIRWGFYVCLPARRHPALADRGPLTEHAGDRPLHPVLQGSPGAQLHLLRARAPRPAQPLRPRGQLPHPRHRPLRRRAHHAQQDEAAPRHGACSRPAVGTPHHTAKTRCCRGNATKGRTVRRSVLALAALLALVATVAVAEAQQAAPTVTTGAATSVKQHSVTLNGSVRPNGANATWYFQYGTTNAYGRKTSNRNTVRRSGHAVRVAQHQRPALRDDLPLPDRGHELGRHQPRCRPHVHDDRADPGPARASRSPPTGTPSGSAARRRMAGQVTGPGNSGAVVSLQVKPFPYTGPFVQLGNSARRPTRQGCSRSRSAPSSTPSTEPSPAAAGRIRQRDRSREGPAARQHQRQRRTPREGPARAVLGLREALARRRHRPRSAPDEQRRLRDDRHEAARRRCSTTRATYSLRARDQDDRLLPRACVVR